MMVFMGFIPFALGLWDDWSAFGRRGALFGHTADVTLLIVGAVLIIIGLLRTLSSRC